MSIQLVYAERDVEDLLVEDCQHYLGLKYITRQFRTPVGIVDVIAASPEAKGLYYVIEIKKDVLDTHAYVQATRYCKWLNSELSKGGSRIFLPIIIGNSLNDELYSVCEYFYDVAFHDVSEIGVVFYRLFKFDPKEGVSFEWHSTRQREYKRTLNHRYYHIQNAIEKLEFEKHCLQTPDTNDHQLTLVKNEAVS